MESVGDFGEFYRREYGRAVVTIALALGDRDRAEEVVQEAFSRAYRRWRSVGRMDRPDAWVVVVALNAERRRFRRDSRTVPPTETRVSAVDHASMVVARVAVTEALAELTDRQRAVVVLRYLADLPFADVAAALGCAEGTARATLHQAMQKLRVELADEEP